MTLTNPFSTTYKQARQQLLKAAGDAGLKSEAHVKPHLGIEGEVLALDVVHMGPPQATQMLVLSSGCHGVEGYSGSGVQIACLQDPLLHQWLQDHEVALLILHALNPYGFSYARRVTAQNVDLNRNCIDFNQPLPANPGYAALHDLLLPAFWPPNSDNAQALGQAIQGMGMRQFQDAVTRGQYDHADGIFYGGQAPTWSQLTFATVLKNIPWHVQRLAWIDLHTGLGPRGVGERIFTGGGADNALGLAQQWWGDVTSTEDKTAVSSALTGQLGAVVVQQLGQRLLSSITLEFGTCEPLLVLHALRADAWAHSARPGAQAWKARSAQDMKNAFFINEADWKSAVLEQSMAAVWSAVNGLAQTSINPQ
ncbi:MAG: M14 family metallopeptidase [Rhodoferax sp.]|nr:M14 family metallopeptidase [Rhodoferax sp.]